MNEWLLGPSLYSENMVKDHRLSECSAEPREIESTCPSKAGILTAKQKCSVGFFFSRKKSNQLYIFNDYSDL